MILLINKLQILYNNINNKGRIIKYVRQTFDTIKYYLAILKQIYTLPFNEQI